MRFLPEIWKAIVNERDWMLGLTWLPYYSGHNTIDRWEDELEPDRRWYWTIQEIHMTINTMRILEEKSEKMWFR